MRLWRITRRPFQALDGEGARLHGGRWNSEGVPVIYTSSTLALAALEYLVHIDVEDVPDDLVALAIEVPDELPVAEIALRDLPPDWHTVPDHPVCLTAGDRWVGQGAMLILRVPSVVIPEESNFLLNPRHPDASRLRVASTRDFFFDPRLL